MFRKAFSKKEDPATAHPHDTAAAPIHAGFCSGGPDWPYEEQIGLDSEGRDAFLEDLGERQARCVARAGGDFLRMLYMSSTFFGEDFHTALYHLDKPVRAMWPPQLSGRLMWIRRVLAEARAQIEADTLNWRLMDAFLRGVVRFNRSESESAPAVRVLLCLVDFPPRAIIEMPPGERLEDIPVDARRIWSEFIHVQIGLTRRIIRRYGAPEWGACVGALEVINEPDYNWIPDESRIERALQPTVYPLGKYLTELHLSQIPERQQAAPPFFREQGGYYVDQPLDPSLPFGNPRSAPATPVLDYDWGPLFDRYVWCVADMMEHVAFAARDEANLAGLSLRIVSGAVTHNNLDYLARMYKANSNVFRYVDAIGLHPYHWPRHDMHDQDFRSTKPMNDWRASSPRAFARDYFKRFDFIEEIAALASMDDDAESFGMAGKKIWLTEFGIPTKKAAHANADCAANRNLFLYRRGEEVPEPIYAIVWEDKWDRFFEQVSPAYLRDNHVEALLLYTMRGGGMGESTDEEHSNFTLFAQDCRTPRMEAATFRHMTGRLAELTGRADDPAYFTAQPAESGIPWTWRAVSLRDLPSAPGMIDPREIQFLVWCATQYKGRGAVIDLGAFLGRSALALAAGLEKSGYGEGVVTSFDCFVWDEWSLNHYRELAFHGLSEADLKNLPPDVRDPSPGSSFRPLFDLHTRPFGHRIQTVEANLDAHSWTGASIEILFVDAAKSWPTLDRIVHEFFSCLVDGAAVIHQDYKHFFTWWLHPVTERMIADGVLEPMENISGTPSQVFRYHLKEDFAPARYTRDAFTDSEIDTLLAASAERYSGSDHLAVAGARICFLLQIGRTDEARHLFNTLLATGPHPETYAWQDILNLVPADWKSA